MRPCLGKLFWCVHVVGLMATGEVSVEHQVEPYLRVFAASAFTGR